MLQIAFAGEMGNPCEGAVWAYFGDTARPTGKPTVAEAIRSVMVGETDGAVIPLANSLMGQDRQVIRFLAASDLEVVDHLDQRADVCLLAMPGQTLRDIRQVLSDPTLLSACEAFLRKERYELVRTFDSAASARFISEEQRFGVAAVAPARAAHLYHLEIVARDLPGPTPLLVSYVVLRQKRAPRQTSDAGLEVLGRHEGARMRELSAVGSATPLAPPSALANAAQRPPVPEDQNGRYRDTAGAARRSALAPAAAAMRVILSPRSPTSAPGYANRQLPADFPLVQETQHPPVWRPAPLTLRPVRPGRAAPALVLEGVCKVYVERRLWGRKKEHLAVDHLTLQVERGTIFGLLGPNGSGKTTTINLLCGFLRPTSGSIRILGFDTRRARDLRHIRQRLGAVPQETALYEELTAQENLAFHAGLYGVPHRQRARRIKEMLHLAGLFERRHDRVKTFSGGMKRRLAIARALLHDPQLLYLDEPTLGVDVQSRRAIWEYIRALSAEGKTVLITTNQLDEAQSLCHCLAIIDHGRLIDQGTPASLKQRYGASVVELDLATPLDSLERLERVEGVLRVSPNGPRTHVTITTEQMNEVLPRLLAHLPSPPTSIAVHEPSLDDVFLHLTGAALRD